MLFQKEQQRYGLAVISISTYWLRATRIFDGTSATLPTVVGHAFADEIFDSIPYQKLSSGDPFKAYNAGISVGTDVFPDFCRYITCIWKRRERFFTGRFRN